MLNRLPDAGINLLRQVIEESIATGVSPKTWKEGETVTIFKGGGKTRTEMASYRPITLTSVISKVAEKIVVDLLWGPGGIKDCDAQYAYRAGRSCEQLAAVLASRGTRETTS